jgi:hypothetical protein
MLKTFYRNENGLINFCQTANDRKPSGEGWTETANHEMYKYNGGKSEWFDVSGIEIKYVEEAERIKRGLQTDSRGVYFNIETMEEYRINNLDEDIDETIYTKEIPIENEAYQKYDKQKKKWVIDTVKKEKAEKDRLTAEKKQRINAIESRLDIIDIRRLRPKEAINDGIATVDDMANLERLDNEKAALKIEHNQLSEELKSA